MSLKDLERNIKELLDVAPCDAPIAGELGAAESALWVSISREAESEVEELLGPAIKTAFDNHRKLTGQRKKMLEGLLAVKERVRAQLAQWIVAGNPVQHCTVRTKYKVTVENASEVSSEFLMMTPDLEAIQKFVDENEGKQPVDGCKIEAIQTLVQEKP